MTRLCLAAAPWPSVLCFPALEYNEIMNRHTAGDPLHSLAAFRNRLTAHQIREGQKPAQAVKSAPNVPAVPVEFFAGLVLSN
jgi:hypothetical protein